MNLSSEVRSERATRRLQAGQWARVVATSYNFHVSTIYRLQQQYNDSNNITDRSRCESLR